MYAGRLGIAATGVRREVHNAPPGKNETLLPAG
jgi:hypothetical protein